MKNDRQLELVVHSKDATTIEDLVAEMGNVQVTPARTSRAIDPVTVLGIAAGVTTLINSLLDLAKRLKKRKDSITIVVRNIDGDSVDLRIASDEEIRLLVQKQ